MLTGLDLTTDANSLHVSFFLLFLLSFAFCFFFASHSFLSLFIFSLVFLSGISPLLLSMSYCPFQVSLQPVALSQMALQIMCTTKYYILACIISIIRVTITTVILFKARHDHWNHLEFLCFFLFPLPLHNECEPVHVKMRVTFIDSSWKVLFVVFATLNKVLDKTRAMWGRTIKEDTRKRRHETK